MQIRVIQNKTVSANENNEMPYLEIDEIDVVELVDGRTGTVLMIFTDPTLAYEVEFFETEWYLETVKPEQIAAVYKRVN